MDQKHTTNNFIC